MNIHPTARQILDIVHDGAYVAPSGARVDVRALQDDAARRTELFRPLDLEHLFEAPGPGGGPPRVEVVDATTQRAAQALAGETGDVVLLNFASARNPGGGFLGGALAQEEELCRCSGLYPLLADQPEYYHENHAARTALYTDHILYSRDVPFFRTSAKDPFLERPFLASVITAPAPNAAAIHENTPDHDRIPEVFARRWRNVLLVAHARSHRTVLLGAWGCGAFRNDPEVAAGTVSPWLTSVRFAGCFDRVVFAIPGRGQSGANLEVFRRHFGG